MTGENCHQRHTTQELKQCQTSVSGSQKGSEPRNAEEFGTGVNQELEKLTKQLKITLEPSRNHNPNGGMDIKERKQLS